VTGCAVCSTRTFDAALTSVSTMSDRGSRRSQRSIATITSLTEADARGRDADLPPGSAPALHAPGLKVRY
jgi:hypothetical protein